MYKYLCDHYAVFHVAGNMHGGQSSSDGKNVTPVMKLCQRNIQEKKMKISSEFNKRT